ncbi:kinase-like domain-containing protein [Infundibulicybe gibba]|nr:kinase-like domain-containing protein [Infundibulicybe gibba]
MPSSWDPDYDCRPSSPASSDDSSFDEDEVNRRITPYWPAYRAIIKSRGFHLDTVGDVKQFYKNRHGGSVPDSMFKPYSPRHLPTKTSSGDDDLCPDAGLPDNLFRGCRTRDGKKIVVKAVHLYSREHDVIRLLSSPPLRDDPMNHTIPVLDLIEVADDDIVFIVMEEWSSQLITETRPCCLTLFLRAIRQCIEVWQLNYVQHAVFMHKNRVAHLDISLRNLVTDFNGHYAYIDYELSRRFDNVAKAHVNEYRGTEVPPECEDGNCSDAFKVDVWALAVLILRACKLVGYHVPELMRLVRPMLHDNPSQRPSIRSVLNAFDSMIPLIGLPDSCQTSH